MAEPTKAPATTAPVDFIVPNQDLFERVIDQRLAAHSKQEETATKAKSTRTAAATKDADKS